jgi:hypothetical protein
MANGNLTDEYKELNANMRLHVTLRFSLITIFLAMNGGLLSILSNAKQPMQLVLYPALLGLVGSIIFFILEERIADYYWHYRHRVEEIERQLGFQAHQVPVPSWLLPDWLTSRIAARAVYLLFALFWLSNTGIVSFARWFLWGE